MQDREPTSRRLDDLSYLTDMVTSCFAIEEEIFFRCEATDMVSERNEGNEEGNGYRVGKPPRGTKGVGIVVRMWRAFPNSKNLFNGEQNSLVLGRVR